jgi:hypothetical protein
MVHLTPEVTEADVRLAMDVPTTRMRIKMRRVNVRPAMDVLKALT